MRHSSFITASLCAGVSILALAASQSAAHAASDIGSVNIDTAHDSKPRHPAHAKHSNGKASAHAARPSHTPVVAAPAGPPISSDAAIGNNAPVGSAPALSVAQQSLNAIEPGSVVSRKVIEDVVIPTGDYNETAKYTPNFVSNNANGPLGDSKSSWRGFQDGQFNVTYDGVPFGDDNDPTHHSAAYFPSAFIGQAVVDRGPGPASQVGYATFGGTLGLQSLALSDVFSGNIQASIGNFNTSMESVTVQSGYNKEFQTRALIQYEHAFTDGQYDWGHDNQQNFLLKVEKQLGDVTLTVFGTYGTENYNNVTSIDYQQWQTYGKNYGGINNNPATQQYYGYNNSEKRTDMEYIDTKAEEFGFQIDNKIYTYAYDYPNDQNNGTSQVTEGVQANSLITKATAATATSNACAVGQYKTKSVNAAGTSINTCISGIAATDVIGYIKYNDYRNYGDIFSVKRDIGQDWYSGQLRFGVWFEHAENGRLQEYIDYTTGQNFAQLGAGNGAYKLKLEDDFNNVQPYVEFDWRPIANLSITPGYKFESFTRMHDAIVNNTSLAPLSATNTWTSNLPFLTVRYKINDQLSVYGQASQGYLVPAVEAFYTINPSADTSISPETTTNYQIGVVYKTAEFTADADIYQQRATNFPITITPTTGPDAGVGLYENGGTAQYRGFETEGTWAFGRRVGLEGLGFTGSWGLSNAHFTQGQSTGLAVGNAPSYTLAGGLIYDDKTIFGSLLQKFTGESWGDAGQYANTQLGKVPGYNSTDFVIGYRYKLADGFANGLGKSVEFKLGVQNILDHRSVVEIAGQKATDTAQGLYNTDMTYSFQSGRYVYGAVKYSF